jgi:hypothetical protein
VTESTLKYSPKETKNPKNPKIQNPKPKNITGTSTSKDSSAQTDPNNFFFKFEEKKFKN